MPGRRYPKVTKAAAIVAAEATSITAASEATGIPRTTIQYWLDQPEFVDLRHNAREHMAEEALVVARLGWQMLAKAIARGEVEARDLVMAVGMATDKSQLLNGAATARTEARDITGTISDTELVAAIREVEHLTGSGDSRTEGAPAGAAEGEGL